MGLRLCVIRSSAGVGLLSLLLRDAMLVLVTLYGMTPLNGLASLVAMPSVNLRRAATSVIWTLTV